jgi:hypothetical protein
VNLVQLRGSEAAKLTPRVTITPGAGPIYSDRGGEVHTFLKVFVVLLINSIGVLYDRRLMFAIWQAAPTTAPTATNIGPTATVATQVLMILPRTQKFQKGGMVSKPLQKGVQEINK